MPGKKHHMSQNHGQVSHMSHEEVEIQTNFRSFLNYLISLFCMESQRGIIKPANQDWSKDAGKTMIVLYANDSKMKTK